MRVDVVDLGVMEYEEAYQRQAAELERVVASRDSMNIDRSPGILLLVEHPPVVTVSRRPGAASNLVASEAIFAQMGVQIRETDRGGDVTYHGPGQLVVYPILDLNTLNLGLHAYMRLLEEAVIRTCAKIGVPTMRDPGATGVWTVRPEVAGAEGGTQAPAAKIAAMGVRVRRWVSMHGLSLNVNPDMSHFNLIVPCGLHGRAVTGLKQELGDRCPSMEEAKKMVVGELVGLIEEARTNAADARSA
jgi:lipoyl(octanoyl) transferase